MTLLVPEKDWLNFFLFFYFFKQEAYSVQKYVKHLQDTLDIFYNEVSF